MNSGQFLSVSPLFVNTEPLPFLSKETEFYIDVIEVPPQGASGALHNNCPSLQVNVDIFWDVDSLIAENGLHSRSRCGKEPVCYFLFLVFIFVLQSCEGLINFINILKEKTFLLC